MDAFDRDASTSRQTMQQALWCNEISETTALTERTWGHRMSLIVRGAMWIGLFLGVAVAPLVFAVIDISVPGRGFATEFSAALGFVGLALMGLEFALVARFQAVAAPFGTDALVQFHREIGLVGLAFILAHIAISAPWDLVIRLFADDTPARVRWAVLATVALLALIGSSLWRKQLRLSYEAWHLLHAVLAMVAIVAALMHVLLVDYYLSSTWKQALWILMSGAFVTLVIWVRIGKPIVQRRRPWIIEQVTHELGRTTTLTLRASGHDGFRFAPGQYGWFAIGRSPFSMTKHPFSFSSNGDAGGTIEVSIKSLGDFTSTVADLEVGTTVYIDGPHGVFSPDLYEGPGFGLIAGGVGITPMVSILRTLAERGDRRPIVAYLANQTWDQVTFREALVELNDRLDLKIVHVLSHAPDGWGGETGRIDADVLRRHLPPGYERWQFFVCGANPMMDAMEEALLALNVPPRRIHTERFDWV
jgi:predicted ferric reductase